MTLRYSLSQLSRPAARRAFGRSWLTVCLAGAVASVVIFGWEHIFFIAVVWLICVFAPVRIAVEALHTRGPRMRDELQRALQARNDRYATREGVVLMVEILFAREVRLPRLAPPDLGGKIIDAAGRLTDRALRGGDGPPAVLRAAATCATLLQRWVGVVAAGERDPEWHPAAEGHPGAGSDRPLPLNGAAPAALWNPRASVQDQWAALRAIAALAGLAKTLTAVYEDSTGTPWEGGASVRALSEAAMDYADQVGLRLDGPAWDDPAEVPPAPLAPELLPGLAETWLTFCAAPPPAPRRLQAFVELLVG
ncbi:MAG TPA: hypothetical protein VKV57_11025 [bacterium]|nr:hypothetical protein [bacterium]